MRVLGGANDDDDDDDDGIIICNVQKYIVYFTLSVLGLFGNVSSVVQSTSTWPKESTRFMPTSCCVGLFGSLNLQWQKFHLGYIDQLVKW